MAKANHLNNLGIKFFFCFLSILVHERIQAQPNSLTAGVISYLSNTSLSVRDVHTDCEQNIIYVGGTGSTAFSISPNTISAAYNGGNSDAFIVKIDSSGKQLWSTLLGGGLYDRAYAVEIDSAGFIYIAGRAGSAMPTTPCALQQQFAGDNNVNSAYGIQDGFITKITPDGSTIVWSTYIGCDGRGFVRDIDIDSKGNIWAGISNASPNFPHITGNALQPKATATMNPALIKLSADGKTLLYGTFLSDGVATSAGPTTVRVDKKDNVYFLSHASANKIPVTKGVFQPKVAGGIDFVISKFDASGKLLFCSFLGGPGNEEVETHSLEIDTTGNVIVAAYTYADGYPVTANVVQNTYSGMRDGVITKISSDGSTILASTYLGGDMTDEIQGIGIDANDHIYVTGRTASDNFPVTTSLAFQGTLGGASDGHITVLSHDLTSILYSTYVGGTGNEDLRACHVDRLGKVHTGGNSASTNFPIYRAFNTTLTGTTTGTAIVFKPKKLLSFSEACQIDNKFNDPCLNTSTQTPQILKMQVLMYPNPATDRLTISFVEPQNQRESIQIYNSLGVLMKEISINESEEIDVEAFPPGLYFISFLNSAFPSQKFLKR